MADSPIRPIRLMRITTRLHISGPALQAILINDALNKRGYETALVTGDTTGLTDNLTSLAQSCDIEPIIAPHLMLTMNPIRLIQMAMELNRIIREFQPDVVHTHTTTAGLIGRIVARLAGVSVIVHTLHTHPYKGMYRKSTSMLFSSVERIGAYFSDSIITLSSSLRQELTEKYHITSKNRVTVLPLGYDLSIFANTPRHLGTFREQFNIPKDVPLVGIIGRLVTVKNHMLFLRVAKRIHEQIPNARFVIVGGGHLESDLRAQVQKMRLSDCVIFAGWQQDMPTVYSDLDAVVITSHNEGTPAPLIESLVMGCPVVATHVGGVSDLLNAGEYGALIPPDDANAFANALIETLNTEYDPEPARNAMMARYDIDRLGTDFDSLYRGLLAQKSPEFQ